MDPSLKEAIPAISIIVVFFLACFMIGGSLVLLLYQLWNLFFPRPRMVYGHLVGLKGLYVLQPLNIGGNSRDSSRPSLIYKHLEDLNEQKIYVKDIVMLILFAIDILAMTIWYEVIATKLGQLWLALSILFLPFIIRIIDIYIQLFQNIRSRKSWAMAFAERAAVFEMKRFRFIPKRLLGALVTKNGRFSVDFQGFFVVHGSAVLAARNEERSVFYDPRDLWDFCALFGSKMTFVSAVLGTSLGLGSKILIGFVRGLLRGSPVWATLGPILPLSFLALIFWLCLGWLRFVRLSRAMRPLIGELNRQPYEQAGGESALGWETPAAIMGLSMWLAWRLLAGL